MTDLRTPACHNREPWANSIRPDCTAWDIPATPTQFLPQYDRFDCSGCRWMPADEELADRLARWNARSAT